MNTSGDINKEKLNSNQIDLFKKFRNRLIQATSKEEMREITQELFLAFRERYKGLKVFALEGNKDILERLQFLLKWSKGKVLDVGAYDGYFILELEKAGFEIDGTDMMEEAIILFTEMKKSHPGSKAKVVSAFSEDLPFLSNSYNTVIISHTLEHVFDPLLSIKECLRTARDRLIIIVPKDLGNDPTHIRVVTEEWLLSALEDNKIIHQQDVGNGFAIVVEKYKRV